MAKPFMELRPWKIYGEGPSTSKNQAKGQFGGVKDVRPYESNDFRFTTKGETLYAFCMSKPTGNIKIEALGSDTKLNSKSIASVELLGCKEKLSWKQSAKELLITKPENAPDWQVYTFKIAFRK